MFQAQNQMEQKYPFTNFRKFGYPSQSSPLFRKFIPGNLRKCKLEFLVAWKALLNLPEMYHQLVTGKKRFVTLLAAISLVRWRCLISMPPPRVFGQIRQ